MREDLVSRPLILASLPATWHYPSKVIVPTCGCTTGAGRSAARGLGPLEAAYSHRVFQLPCGVPSFLTVVRAPRSACALRSRTVCTNTMTIRTYHFALFNFLNYALKTSTTFLAYIKRFCSSYMVKIHDVGRIGHAAIGAGTIFRLLHQLDSARPLSSVFGQAGFQMLSPPAAVIFPLGFLVFTRHSLPPRNRTRLNGLGGH